VEINQAVKLFSKYLKTKKLKFTWERKTILEGIIKRRDHFTSDELILHFERNGVDRISRATVYRSLKLLEEAGIVNSFHLNDVFKVFEVISSEHDHMICYKCGKIIEFFDHRIEKILNEISKKKGFKAISHSINISGLCEECQNKKA
jgi:Fur family ferric uptake transcriptional regulator